MTDYPETAATSRLFAAIARWIERYRARIHADREFAACTPEDVAAIARDLSLTQSELLAITRKGPDSALLLKRMLMALGVDPQKLAETDPLVMRDMQRLCIVCVHKRRCEHDLEEGITTEHYREYCPNAYTLDAILGHNQPPGLNKRV